MSGYKFPDSDRKEDSDSDEDSDSEDYSKHNEDSDEDSEVLLRIIFEKTTYGCECCNDNDDEPIQVVEKRKCHSLPKYLDTLDYESRTANYHPIYYKAIECLSHPSIIRQAKPDDDDDN